MWQNIIGYVGALSFGIFYQIWTQGTLRHILDLFWSFLKYVNLKMMIPVLLFRWLKFTLKPPYSITCCKLQLAIWDTSFSTLRHILGPILVIFEICQFLTIPGPFEYFSNNWVVSENQSFLNEGVIVTPLSV